MLFDLRGAGRRKTVQVTYIFLAFLMGGGLVLFGIGGSGLGGGLLDALSGSNGSSSGNGAYEKRVQQLVTETRAHPKDASAWADLARARFQLASVPDDYNGQTGAWNADGKRVLAQAAAAWQRHVKLAKHPDDGVAGLMVQAYGPTGLNQPANAVSAEEIITEARPTAATFARLAVLAYSAGQTRKGDLASQKAVSLSSKDERKSLKAQLAAAKQQAASATSSATPMPTATSSSGSSGSSGSSSGAKNGSSKGSKSGAKKRSSGK